MFPWFRVCLALGWGGSWFVPLIFIVTFFPGMVDALEKFRAHFMLDITES